MSGGQQALDKRMEEVKSREQAVAQAQTALVKAEEMLRNVTGGDRSPPPPPTPPLLLTRGDGIAEAALREKAEYQAAAKASSREADLVYKAECAARVAAEERAQAAERRLAALQGSVPAASDAAAQRGGGSEGVPQGGESGGGAKAAVLPCVLGAVLGALTVRLF